MCIQTGKCFSVSACAEVVPVTLKFSIKYSTEKKPVDLTNKCGSCVFASVKDKELYKSHDSYVRCVHPDRHFAKKYSAYRARTTKCCKCYKLKED